MRSSLPRVAVLVLGAVLAPGCPSPRLPPDLPPPEYEQPALPPWSRAPSELDASAVSSQEALPSAVAGSGGSGLGPAPGVAAGGGHGGAALGLAGGGGDNLLDPARQAPESAPE